VKDEMRTKEELLCELQALRMQLAGLKKAEDPGHAEIEIDVGNDNKLAALFDSMNDMFSVLDERGCFVFVNEKMNRVLGYEKGELIGKTVFDVHPPETREEVESILAEMREGKRQVCPVPLVKKDGSRISAEMRVFHCRWKGRNLVFGITIDVTERERNARILRESERLYRAVVEDQTELICRFLPDGAFTFVNDAYCKYFDKRREELIGKRLMPLIPEEDREYVRMKFSSIGLQYPVVQYEHRVIPPHRGIRWLEWTDRAFFNDDGTIREFQSVGRDITKRKTAENQLKKVTDRLDFLLTRNPAVIYTCNAGGDWATTFVSENISSVVGYEAEEFLEAPGFWLDHIHPDDRERVLEDIEVFVKAGRHCFEYRFLHKNGSYLWIYDELLMLRDDDGKPAECLGYMIDITIRKEMEEDLRQANVRLEERIRERTGELVAVNKALRESEERYKTYVENSLAGVYVVQDGRFLFLNSNAASFAGYGPEELVDRPSDSVVHPGDRAKVRKNAARMLKGDDLSPYEFRVVTKDGRIRWIMETVTSIQYEGRDAVLGNSMDITENREAEEALKVREELERSIFLSVPHALFGVENRKIFFANDAMEEVCGWKPSELIGQSTRKIFRNDREWEEYGNTIYANLKNSPVFKLESGVPFVRKDGKEILCRITTSRVGSELGTTRRIVTTVEDITERRKAEEDLARERQRLAGIIEGTDVGTWEWNVQTGEVVFNGRWAEIVGYTLEELAPVGIDTWRTLAHPDDLKYSDALVEKHFRGELDLYECEIRMRHKNGTWVWVQDRGRVVTRSGEGKPLTMFGTHTDITERKLAEEERKKLESRLHQARKMEAVGTLAGGIAHDFNNLLMGIQGYATMAKIGVDPSGIPYEDLSRIEELVASGANLTKQILGFARGGRYEIRVLDIGRLLSNTASIFGRAKKEITIHEEYPDDLWNVEADRGQMEQVFMNLLVNAWQAMPGGGQIYIKAENTALDEAASGDFFLFPGRYVKISIIDNGVGMDEKTRKRIFEPFFTTKEMGRGTGLGLATVYGIVKGHKGAIDVHSGKGQGTTFDIYLPATAMRTKTEETGKKETPGYGETVLLVDDEHAVLEVTKRILEFLGYKVLVARNGSEALQVYGENRNRIDVIILDMIMPDMGGGETFERLKRIDPNVKVLFASGYSFHDEADEIFEEGCLGFLQKPFTKDRLSQILREVIKEKSIQ